ncbi:MAG: hypothetical protein ACLR0N_17965 [Bilophila wadsworthia]
MMVAQNTKMKNIITTMDRVAVEQRHGLHAAHQHERKQSGHAGQMMSIKIQPYSRPS